jgi:hypothetical protein
VPCRQVQQCHRRAVPEHLCALPGAQHPAAPASVHDGLGVCMHGRVRFNFTGKCHLCAQGYFKPVGNYGCVACPASACFPSNNAPPFTSNLCTACPGNSTAPEASNGIAACVCKMREIEACWQTTDEGQVYGLHGIDDKSQECMDL